MNEKLYELRDAISTFRPDISHIHLRTQTLALLPISTVISSSQRGSIWADSRDLLEECFFGRGLYDFLSTRLLKNSCAYLHLDYIATFLAVDDFWSCFFGNAKSDNPAVPQRVSLSEALDASMPEKLRELASTMEANGSFPTSISEWRSQEILRLYSDLLFAVEHVWTTHGGNKNPIVSNSIRDMFSLHFMEELYASVRTAAIELSSEISEPEVMRSIVSTLVAEQMVRELDRYS